MGTEGPGSLYTQACGLTAMLGTQRWVGGPGVVILDEVQGGVASLEMRARGPKARMPG